MNKCSSIYKNFKKVLNSNGSASMYVILTFAILMIIVTFSMLFMSRMNDSIKVKDNQTMAEASAVNHFKSTINEYNNLSVTNKLTETVEYGGQKYTVEIVPTDDIKTKKLTKEFDFTHNKIDSTKDYMWDTNFVSNTSPSVKQSVYGTVSAISGVNAKNNSDNQYLIYTNTKYEDSRNPIMVALRGLVNNNINSADKFPPNYIDANNKEIKPINGVHKVRVTKNNDEFEYVKNYPSNLAFPFPVVELGVYLVEYLDKNNNLLYWSRFSNLHEPSKPFNNLFSIYNFLADNLDRRPNTSHASDVPVSAYKNAIVVSETNKYNLSLTEQLQSLDSVHVTDDVQDNKTNGVSLNLVWDYMQACVSEEVEGYPLTGELTPIGMKKLTDYEESNCKANQSKIKYDLSLSKSRTPSTFDSYPFYTNWSFLDPKQVEAVFDYYERNKSELFQCINNSPAYYCNSQNSLEGTSTSNYSNLTRQKVKENFLFCEMPGYRVTVKDSNERWFKFAYEKHLELLDEIEKIKNRLIDEAKASVGGEPITVEEYGELPKRPEPTGGSSASLQKMVASIKDSGLNTLHMPTYATDTSSGVISFENNVLQLSIYDISVLAVKNLNLKQQFTNELARSEKYQVPCLQGLSKTDRNYRYTVDEVPNTSFKLDILTNTATPVKITTRHKPEITNARTSYTMNFFNGTDRTRVYHQADVNSDTDKVYNKIDTVNVKPNYNNLDFANLNKDFSLRTNRLQFSFSSFNRLLGYIKVEYDVIESIKYEYHFYNSKGERLYFTEEVKHNSL